MLIQIAFCNVLLTHRSRNDKIFAVLCEKLLGPILVWRSQPSLGRQMPAFLFKQEGLMQQENLVCAKAQQSTDILYSSGEKLGEFREI